jgi:hypothetical protein
MTTLFFGDRFGCVLDPLVNLWWTQTRIENLDSEEMAKRAEQSEYIEAMKYVTGAQIFPPNKLKSNY